MSVRNVSHRYVLNKILLTGLQFIVTDSLFTIECYNFSYHVRCLLGLLSLLLIWVELISFRPLIKERVASNIIERTLLKHYLLS